MTLGWAATRFAGVLPERQVQGLAEAGATLAATVGPELSHDGLKLVALQCGWLYLFDAKVDGEANVHPSVAEAAFAETHRVLANPTTPTDNPFAEALQGIALQVQDSTGPGQLRRWTNSVAGYLGGVRKEMGYAQDGITPTTEDFIRMRRDTSGVPVVLSLVESAGGFTMPEEVWDGQTIPALTEETVDTVAWHNDLTSYVREAAEGRAQLNLVTVLQENHGYTTQEAVHRAVEMCNAREAVFWQRVRALRADAATNPAIVDYALGAGDWINGYLQFVDEHPRYNA